MSLSNTQSCVVIGSISTHPQASAESLTALVAELSASDDRQDQIALRGNRRLLRRLVSRTAPARSRAIAIVPDGTYLITGGLRGLGLRVCEWLVERGARSIVLMGRRAPDAAADAVIRRLTARGAKLVAVAGDVSREEDVRRALDQISSGMPPLRGIIHAAGVLDDGVLSAQSWTRFATVMAPKVLGSWHLHRLGGPLDFFVLFSSGAAIAGSAGQANHAAANAFEDALAWYRQAQGQPTVSINWGPWAEVGAAVDRGVRAPTFLHPIRPADGLQALGAALRRDDSSTRLCSEQLAVISMDLSNGTADRDQRSSPLFRELHTAGRTAAAEAGPQAAASNRRSESAFGPPPRIGGGRRCSSTCACSR